MVDIFQTLVEMIHANSIQMKALADKLDELEVGKGGGGGNATVADYVPNTTYTRNTLLVDTATETLYRVIPASYTSVSVDTDRQAGNLKLVGYESQIVAFNHPPTQEEIDVLPEDTVVVEYSATDDPYSPILSSDNQE